MKKLLAALLSLLSLLSLAHAGTYASLPFNTSTGKVPVPGFWAGNLYNNFPTNWVCYGDSWASAIDGNSGLLDTNTAWTYQVMRGMGWNFTNYAIAGNGVPGNVNILFSNAVGSNQGAIFALVGNDTANNLANWGLFEMAQLLRLCFANNDPGLRTAVQITNASPTNGAFYPTTGWKPTPNAVLQGYGSTTNGAGLVITNLFGSSVAICVDGFTNGTGADFTVSLDGGTPILYHSGISSYVAPSIPYTSNSIPIVPVFLTGLSSVLHTLCITNFGSGSATNLNINYIAAPDMRQSAPLVVACGGVVDPPNGNTYLGTENLNGMLRTNIWTLNSCGLPVSYFAMAGLVPYGPHGTVSTLHLAPYEATNIANGFLRSLLMTAPQSLAPGNTYLYNASHGILTAPVAIPGLGQFITSPYIQLGLQAFPFYLSDQTGGGYFEFDGSGVVKVIGANGLYLNPGNPAGLTFAGSMATFTGTVAGNGGGLTGLQSSNIVINPWTYTNFASTTFAKFYTNTWGRPATIYWSVTTASSVIPLNAVYLYDTNAVNGSFAIPPIVENFRLSATGSTNTFPPFALPPGGYFAVSNLDAGSSVALTNFVQLE